MSRRCIQRQLVDCVLRRRPSRRLRFRHSCQYQCSVAVRFLDGNGRLLQRADRQCPTLRSRLDAGSNPDGRDYTGGRGDGSAGHRTANGAHELSANAVSPIQINLTWTAATDNVAATGYLIGRCQGLGCNNFSEIDRNEDPDGLLLATDDGTNFVSLQLLHSQARNPSCVESMTRVGGTFEPAIDGIPGDLLDASNGGLVQAVDAEGGDLVEGRATTLESIVRRSGVGAEGLTASLASVSTTPSPFCPVEAVTDDSSGAAAFPASGQFLFAQLRLFIAPGPVDSGAGRPGSEPQILAGTGVTIESPTVDVGRTTPRPFWLILHETGLVLDPPRTVCYQDMILIGNSFSGFCPRLERRWQG